MLHGEREVLLALISDHLVRMLRVASTLQELDAATFATQVCLGAALGEARKQCMHCQAAVALLGGSRHQPKSSQACMSCHMAHALPDMTGYTVICQTSMHPPLLESLQDHA